MDNIQTQWFDDGTHNIIIAIRILTKKKKEARQQIRNDMCYGVIRANFYNKNLKIAMDALHMFFLPHTHMDIKHILMIML